MSAQIGRATFSAMHLATLAIASLCAAFAPSAEAASNVDPWLRDRTIDAVIISRIAGRVCVNLRIDENLAKVAAEMVGVSDWNYLPPDKVAFFAKRFAVNRDQGCEFAWSNYGIGSGGSQNPSLRFLIYSPANPFARPR